MSEPIVNIAWIAARLGITPGRVRRYIAADGPLPRLVPDVAGLSEYAFTRENAEAWIEAYKAAPKLGRRGDGSAQRKRKLYPARRANTSDMSVSQLDNFYRSWHERGKDDCAEGVEYSQGAEIIALDLAGADEATCQDALEAWQQGHRKVTEGE